MSRRKKKKPPEPLKTGLPNGMNYPPPEPQEFEPVVKGHITIELEHAELCLDCDRIISHAWSCPHCGSWAIIPLKGWIPQIVKNLPVSSSAIATARFKLGATDFAPSKRERTDYYNPPPLTRRRRLRAWFRRIIHPFDELEIPL